MKVATSTILLFALFMVSSAMNIAPNATNWLTDDAVHALYKSWLVEHGKTYNILGEKGKRFRIFKDNLRFIDNHNAGDHTYKLGLNKFADLTNEEFHAMYTGLSLKTVDARRKLSVVESKRYTFQQGDVLPESVDWSKRGITSPVKNQGKCTSSWVFSATGAVEAIYRIHGESMSLSEQQILDCSQSFAGVYGRGCKNGRVDYAFEYMKTHHLFSVAEQPYRAAPRRCFESGLPNVTIHGYEKVPDDELSLKKGIITRKCLVKTKSRHYVVIAGYGSEKGKDYWLLKNSWGAEWGEGGYFKIPRSDGCVSTRWATYPIF